MGFQKISPQQIRDELAGVSLEIVDMYSLRYTDNDHTVTIDTEALKKDGKYSVCLYLSALESWDNPTDVAITDDDKKQIQHNIEQAFKLLDADCEVS